MEKDINKIVWNNIKTLRKKLNITQNELSDKIWVSRTRITQVELWTQSPTLNTLKLISEGLEVEIKELFK
jgi:transcriptional regulator with XRE-family HTH domain